MSAQVIPITATQDAAWTAFVAAHQRAQQTLDHRDGIAAGKALRRFYDLFLTAEQRGRQPN
jgi:hypothetical protein